MRVLAVLSGEAAIPVLSGKLEAILVQATVARLTQAGSGGGGEGGGHSFGEP